ncbi:MAG: DUF2877 domain-containing protein [Elusimicrobia bacterium]|nr:DUF2877 domain-containing protein [Elusimicrobiota bacterium]
MTKVLSFGDRIGPGDYALHSRFDQAVNFTRDGRLASIVVPAIGGGPINIVMEGLDFSSIRRLEVSGDSFSLDGASFPKLPLFDSALRVHGGAKVGMRRLRDLLLRKAHPKSLAFLLDDTRCAGLVSGFEKVLTRRLQTAARELRSGNLEAGAEAARGAGLGLTPSGDDLLSGYLWGLHVRQRICGGDSAADIDRVYGCSRGSNPLSTAFLDCAREGRFFERLRDLLAEPSEDRLDEVLAVGETSGADTCVGLMLALEKEDSLWS